MHSLAPRPPRRTLRRPLRPAGVAIAWMLFAAVVAASAANAFNFFPFGVGQALKWGASNQLGTPGGVVTWSLMPDGTTLDPLVAGFDWSGTSDLASLYAQVGGEAAAVAALESAFAAWSTIADIEFVRVDESGVLPFGATTPGAALVGHIRVGAFAFAPGDFTAAVGFAAPPNGGTTLEGDLVFNVNNRFGLPAGLEGAPFDLYPPPTFFYLNDFAGLATHEIGHSLGLAHSDVPESVMCGYVGPGFDGSLCHWADPDANGQAPITRVPKPDDVAGARHLYGVPEPGIGIGIAVGGGAFVLGARRRGLRRSGARRSMSLAEAMLFASAHEHATAVSADEERVLGLRVHRVGLEHG